MAAAGTAIGILALLTAGCGSGTGLTAGPSPQVSGVVTVLPSSPGNPGVVIADDSSNGKTVYIQVGAKVELILSSTYWTVHSPSVPAVLRQDGDTSPLPRPSTCPTIPGLGCVPVQTDFTALTPGTAVISASRVSCGEAMRCPPDKEHFSLTVTVQK
jgi:hypothetical protein